MSYRKTWILAAVVALTIGACTTAESSEPKPTFPPTQVEKVTQANTDGGDYGFAEYRINGRACIIARNFADYTISVSCDWSTPR